MRFLIYILLLGVFTLAAIWLVPYLPGYVLIRIGGWAVETSVIALVVLLILIYFLMSGSVWLWNLPGRASRRYAEKRSRAQLELGMLALAEGDWSKAERALKKSARNSATPSVSYIAAAQAAHGPGAEARRARYLAQAEESGDSQASVLITRARLLLSERDPEGALEVLTGLPDRLGRPRALDLLARCYEQLERWDELAAIAPDLVKHGILDSDQALRITSRAVAHRLAAAESLASLNTAWQGLSRAQRRETGLLVARAERALALNGAAELEPELRKVLSKQWNEDLGRVYLRIDDGDVTARLKAAEGWHRQHPTDPVLNLLLGRLCRRAELWGKARDYLDKATAGDGIAGAWTEIGLMHEAQGETEAALAAFRAELARSDPALAAQGGSHQASQSRSASERAAESASDDSQVS